jgi:hypothetical protein
MIKAIQDKRTKRQTMFNKTGYRQLCNRGYFNSLWKNYKHSKVREALRENGKLKYMCKKDPSSVIERPPTAV